MTSVNHWLTPGLRSTNSGGSIPNAASSYLVFGLQPRLAHEMTMVKELRLAHEGLLDQETGLRGYVATGEGSFLQPYIQGRGQSRTAEKDLLNQLGRENGYADRVVKMLLAEEQWRVGWAEEAVRPGREADDRARARSLPGQWKRLPSTTTAPSRPP
jgi:CHASE3 domain